LGAAALPVLTPIARAQNYPARPARIIVGFLPGSGADVLARLMAQRLSERPTVHCRKPVGRSRQWPKPKKWTRVVKFANIKPE
jgi:hypothetical protein